MGFKRYRRACGATASTARHSPHVPPQHSAKRRVLFNSWNEIQHRHSCLSCAHSSRPSPRALARRSRPRAHLTKSPSGRRAAPLRPPRGPAGRTSRPSHLQENRQHPARAGDTDSPYYPGLADVLTERSAFPPSSPMPSGPSKVSRRRTSTDRGRRGMKDRAGSGPLVTSTSSPGRSGPGPALRRSRNCGKASGRPIQRRSATRWLHSGTGSFHATITSRPMLSLPSDRDHPNRSRGHAESRTLTPASAAVAFSIAHLASDAVIGAAEGSKYRAL